MSIWLKWFFIILYICGYAGIGRLEGFRFLCTLCVWVQVPLPAPKERRKANAFRLFLIPAVCGGLHPSVFHLCSGNRFRCTPPWCAKTFCALRRPISNEAPVVYPLGTNKFNPIPRARSPFFRVLSNADETVFNTVYLRATTWAGNFWFLYPTPVVPQYDA